MEPCLEQKIIGCDIGGVLKTSTKPRLLIPGSIEGLKLLSKTFKVVLISKTIDPTHARKSSFLKNNGIDFLEVYYCEKYEGKIELAQKTKINYMIDDRMEVLSILPSHIKKLWFCNNEKLIESWSSKDEFKDVINVKNWEAVIHYFSLNP